MNFELNADQHALRESLERVLRDRFDFQTRQALRSQDVRFPAELWEQYVTLGLTGLWAPEALGGYAGGASDMLAVLPAMGTALTLDPFREAIVIASAALGLGGDSELCQTLLAQSVAGQTRLAWAHDDGLNPVLAAPSASAWRLTGTKPNVAFGDTSHGYLVSAMHEAPQGSTAPTVFYVPSGADGLTVTPVRLVDDTPAATLEFDETPATPVWEPGGDDSANAWQTVELIGMAAACAEMLGTAEGAFGLASDYVNVRTQFGRTMADNQAVRHHVADMCVNLEMCRSMVIAAVVGAAQGEAALVWQSKSVLGDYGRRICHTAIQLHGGIGMTEEHRVGHYLRRLHVLDQRFASRDALIERLAMRESTL